MIWTGFIILAALPLWVWLGWRAGARIRHPALRYLLAAAVIASPFALFLAAEALSLRHRLPQGWPPFWEEQLVIHPMIAAVAALALAILAGAAWSRRAAWRRRTLGGILSVAAGLTLAAPAATLLFLSATHYPSEAARWFDTALDRRLDASTRLEGCAERGGAVVDLWGGRWRACQIAFPDGGRVCTDSSQCQGGCWYITDSPELCRMAIPKPRTKPPSPPPAAARPPASAAATTPALPGPSARTGSSMVACATGIASIEALQHIRSSSRMRGPRLFWSRPLPAGSGPASIPNTHLDPRVREDERE